MVSYCICDCPSLVGLTFFPSPASFDHCAADRQVLTTVQRSVIDGVQQKQVFQPVRVGDGTSPSFLARAKLELWLWSSGELKPVGFVLMPTGSPNFLHKKQ